MVSGDALACAATGRQRKELETWIFQMFFIFFIVNIYFTLCITTSKNHKWGIAVPNIQRWSL